MSIAEDIIGRRVPDFARYIREGESLDDLDEYGFTPLIETAITRQVKTAELLLDQGVQINKPDATGRTALHWAVDNHDLELSRLLLARGANPNAYTSAGLAILVYPVLRGQDELKQLLYHHGAKLDFALDFIAGKLLGHRFELQGDVDILNAEGEFIELDYEGFILEFTIAVLKDSLRRFTSSYSTKQLRHHFPYVHAIIDGFSVADQLLQFQHIPILTKVHQKTLAQLAASPLLILPAASRGHAIGFVRYQSWWAKVDRGENSLKEGSVILYRMARPDLITGVFLQEFLYKKQSREFYHERINQLLGLEPVAQIPMSAQIVGNCSWANMQALVPVAYVLLQQVSKSLSYESALTLYDAWVEWDKDRALDECIQRFYLVDRIRKASYAAMLGGVLFQACDDLKGDHVKRAEKIVPILSLPDYDYILKSYLETYCIKRLTRRGNNLLKLLDDCGVNPNIGINPIATGLRERQ